MARHKRTYNTNLIKKTISYSIFDIAKLFGVHRATVRNWFKAGLKRIDDKRPFLVDGADLEVFLKDRQKKRRRKCQPDELFCCRCRRPQKAKDNKVLLEEVNHKIGRLRGLCSQCGSRTYRAISLKKLNNLTDIFTFIPTQGADL